MFDLVKLDPVMIAPAGGALNIGVICSCSSSYGAGSGGSCLCGSKSGGGGGDAKKDPGNFGVSPIG